MSVITVNGVIAKPMMVIDNPPNTETESKPFPTAGAMTPEDKEYLD